jgi:predicted O-linked N-acetylglucosamine transferase (SPINDLY family)
MNDDPQSANLNDCLQLAHDHRQHGRLEEAERAYREALLQYPKKPAALHGLGLVLHLQRKSTAAVEFLRWAVSEAPDCAEFRSNLAVVLGALGKHGEAERELNIALQFKPDYSDGWRNLGAALEAQGKPDEAIDAFRRATQCSPPSVEAFIFFGNALCRRGRFRDAEQVFRDAIKLNPGSAREHYNLGKILEILGQDHEAEAEYERATSLEPLVVRSKVELGRFRVKVGKYDAATTVLEQAVKVDPQCQIARRFAVRAYIELGEVDAALKHLRAMLSHDPDSAELRSSLLYTLHYDEKSTPEMLFEEHREWDRCHGLPLPVIHSPHRNNPRIDRRLKIGYISPDFRDHTVTRFISEAIEHHNRDAVKVVCYNDSKASDLTTNRIREWADTWRDIGGMSDEDAERLIRQDLIDILVDLRGHGIHNRLTLLTRKPAPVQAVMVGYFDTTGLSAMDYRITDPQQDPAELTDPFHVEKLIRLPNTCWCYTPGENDPEVVDPPFLSRGYVTFGCLNKIAKISSTCAKLWAQLLESVPGSQLLLVAPEADSSGRVRHRLAEYGLPTGRLTILDKAPSRREYLERYNSVDISLDPFPFNGITTSCDSLWMGVPVVTLAGRLSVSRVGSSILAAAGFPDLITQDEQSYVTRASELVTDIARLIRLRRDMRFQLKRSALMNGPQFSASLEAAFIEMWTRWSKCAV